MLGVPTGTHQQFLTPLSTIDLTNLHDFSFHHSESGVDFTLPIFKAFIAAGTNDEKPLRLKSFSLNTHRPFRVEQEDKNGDAEADSGDDGDDADWESVDSDSDDGDTDDQAFEVTPFVTFLRSLQQAPINNMKIHFLTRRQYDPDPPIPVPSSLRFTFLKSLSITSNVVILNLGTSMPHLEDLTLRHHYCPMDHPHPYPLHHLTPPALKSLKWIGKFWAQSLSTLPDTTCSTLTTLQIIDNGEGSLDITEVQAILPFLDRLPQLTNLVTFTFKYRTLCKVVFAVFHGIASRKLAKVGCMLDDWSYGYIKAGLSRHTGSLEKVEIGIPDWHEVEEYDGVSFREVEEKLRKELGVGDLRILARI
ncbi:hypothetical protein HDV00_001027 [Rhizophlyctis rosea]|nr:hypothetical protein HDV00_001027 [Rhizophlyctis rosea]